MKIEDILKLRGFTLGLPGSNEKMTVSLQVGCEGGRICGVMKIH